MSIHRTIERMLERFGEKITIDENGAQRDTYGVIQPLLYKNKMYINGLSLPAGYFDGGHYLMIASAEVKIKDWRNTILNALGQSFRIKRAEVISSGGCDMYIWAVLIPAKPQVEDDYDEYDRSA